MQVSADPSTSLNRVTSESDPNYYLGQWAIRVSDVDPVSTLIHLALDIAVARPSWLPGLSEVITRAKFLLVKLHNSNYNKTVT